MMYLNLSNGSNCSCFCIGNEVNPSNSTAEATVSFFLGSLALLVTVSNILVLYAVFIERTLHTAGNLYIVSLSVSDFIVGIIAIPLNILHYFRFINKEKVNTHLCKFWLITDYVASTASILSILLLCVDRYRAVCQPLKYLRYRTRAMASAYILGVWILSFLWIIPITFSVDIKDSENYICETNFCCNAKIKIPAAVINFYIPCFILLLFYANIYSTIRKRFSNMENIKHFSSKIIKKKSVRSNGTQTMTLDQQSNTISSDVMEEENMSEHMLPASISNNPKHGIGENDSVSTHVQNKIEASENLKMLKHSGILQSDGNMQYIKNTLLSQQPISGSNVKDKQEQKESVSFQTSFWQRLCCCCSKQSFQELSLKQEAKAAKQLGIIIAAFMICWIPYFVTFIIRPLCSCCISYEVQMFTVWLGYANSALNPFIYVWMNSNFRKPFKCQNVLNS
ncbi:histamine H1 receptor-like isoform X2 [Protopterus annectens]|nr:histamine H1 receptor-like isoform X2 [Protopterus annectens]XP_043933984.1 histamine H1 receptor-like isoform X2 [Protopterus annectens]